jgi:hypothetical protein
MADEIEPIRVDRVVHRELDHLAERIEESLNSDVVAILGPIFRGLDRSVRDAIERRENRRDKLSIVLETPGGIIEVVDRMVQVIRTFYKEVVVVVPNQAMSAGTVFAMSGDSIMMDYFSCLGPIDPQVEKNGRLVPALSYLVQFDRLKERAAKGEITSAEMVLLQQLDLAELHSFEEARELSITLLKEWLATYKFKDWVKTETRNQPVTAEMREQRALEVAEKLMDHQRWHSHGRPISMEILRRDLKLQIDDFGVDARLSEKIRAYPRFLMDYMGKVGAFWAVHSVGYLDL